MMNFYVITLPLVDETNFSSAVFDLQKYGDENSITLTGEPVSATKDGNNLVLVYKGYKNEDKEPQKPFSRVLNFM